MKVSELVWLLDNQATCRLILANWRRNIYSRWMCKMVPDGIRLHCSALISSEHMHTLLSQILSWTKKKCNKLCMRTISLHRPIIHLRLNQPFTPLQSCPGLLLLRGCPCACHIPKAHSRAWLRWHFLSDKGTGASSAPAHTCPVQAKARSIHWLMSGIKIT
jgi:hypothetical protein